jgi:hypothetical protein
MHLLLWPLLLLELLLLRGGTDTTAQRGKALRVKVAGALQQVLRCADERREPCAQPERGARRSRRGGREERRRRRRL